MLDSQRDGIVRTLSVFFIVWSFLGPIDSSFIEFKANFSDDSVLNSILNTWEVLWILKAVLVAASVALIRSPANLILSSIQLISGSLFLYLGVVSNSIWNYNTHIIVISILTFISGLPTKNKNAKRDLVGTLSFVFATIYFQAAISKLVVSGIEWMSSGLSIFMHLKMFNPPLSALLGGDPILFQTAGWLTVIGEIILGTLFVVPRTRKLAAVISVLFHVMLWLTFHISFWHLWIFYPAVYFNWANDLKTFTPVDTF